MAQKDPSRTEHATPKRRRKARGEGNVPKSQEVSKTFVTMAGTIGLYVYMDYISKQMMALFEHFFRYSTNFEVSRQSVYDLMLWISEKLAFMLLPIMLFLAFVAILVLRLQVGKLWTTKVFKPKLSKFNLIKGLQRIFVSPQTFIRLGKSLLLALVIGVAPYIVIRNEIDNFLPLFYATPTAIGAYLLETGYTMVKYAMLPMLVIAIADLWYTRWDYEEKLKMTKDEVKDERKQAEGDPRVKAEQRQKMMKVMAARMLADVPKADVVVTNPTHFAVALRYDAIEAPAPIVLAKGVDHLAERIKQVARENGVPIRENVPLARALYKQVEVGDMIPEELYQAVASLLATLMKFRPRPQGQ
ncbi:flagellar biosynthesis protein FlhB [Oleidesulfovibrio sp.]|uniref:flagellar biosynthesis protein FlhB n=1 Tax=Oleidesulfovibrio sp. TaxID=2909707 RepID=UPI003A869584